LPGLVEFVVAKPLVSVWMMAKTPDVTPQAVRGSLQQSSGQFAVMGKAHEFTLVPRWPVINRLLGRKVARITQGGSVSWQLG